MNNPINSLVRIIQSKITPGNSSRWLSDFEEKPFQASSTLNNSCHYIPFDCSIFDFLLFEFVMFHLQ